MFLHLAKKIFWSVAPRGAGGLANGGDVFCSGIEMPAYIVLSFAKWRGICVIGAIDPTRGIVLG